VIAATFRTDLAKQLRRPRTWVALGLMCAIPILMTIAIDANPPHDRENNLFYVAAHSGFYLPAAALMFMSHFLLLVVVCLFAGDAIAAEAGWGNLRYLLVRPVPRPRLLAGKLAVVILFVVLATAAITVTGLVVGGLVLGFDAPQLPFLGLGFTSGQLLGRLGLATVYVAWSMSGIVCFGFLLSTLVDAPTGAVFGAVGLGIVSQILDAITPLGRVRSILPTHHLEAWRHLFLPFDGSTNEMWKGVALQLPYIAVCCALAWWWFQRKDIVS
jgi:ABC-2 type transport system permease protein